MIIFSLSNSRLVTYKTRTLFYSLDGIWESLYLYQNTCVKTIDVPYVDHMLTVHMSRMNIS